jgi:adenosine deaminase
MTGPADGPAGAIDVATYLRRLPKVELHCHVHGTLRPATFVDLARKHDIPLPTYDVDALYRYDNIYDFLQIVELACATLRDRDDFARAAYEALEDGKVLGNLKYQEMFVDPTLHHEHGVSAATVFDGLADGIRDAEHDLGVRAAVIANVCRQHAPSAAVEMVQEVIALARPSVIGIGMDHAEAPDPPEKFVDAFQLAGRAGLHRTSHAAEDAPPVNITTCLDQLGVERIDHGYYIVDDLAVMQRCLDDGIHFTCTPTSTAIVYGWPDLTQHPITGMIAAGLSISLGSDDPPMFQTDLGNEYVTLFAANGYPVELAKRMVYDGLDACWLDPSDKATLRATFDAEIAALDAQLATG